VVLASASAFARPLGMRSHEKAHARGAFLPTHLHFLKQDDLADSRPHESRLGCWPDSRGVR